MLFEVGAPSEHETLIDRLLREQRDLTPVERFSTRQDHLPSHSPRGQFRELIPGKSPDTGEQYAFAVDLDVCSGCKACVSACHSMNGLEEDEMWRSTGLLLGSDLGGGWQQTITTACHHCIDPGCLNGCPVQAYEKLPSSGVVRHLDDQCIGCQYCMMKCPYDVPKYSKRLGIVRKCDLCIDRLENGEAPACVQACPHEAIRIDIVSQSSVEERTRTGTRLVPGAFDSAYTMPTTRYHSRQAIPRDARPADQGQLRLEHPHWPLIVMLILSQTAVGLLLCNLPMGLESGADLGSRWLVTASWLALHAGLLASIFHLGRPMAAWRFFLGLRTSWMSREILAFGILSGLNTTLLAAAWLRAPASLTQGLAVACAMAGVGAVLTSAMIYIDTRRPYWSARCTLPRFIGATMLLGTSAAAAILAFVAPSAREGLWCALAAAGLRSVLFLWDQIQRAHILQDPEHRCFRSVLTTRNLLRWLPRIWTALFAISTFATLLALKPFPGAKWFALVSFLSTMASLALERMEFFCAVTAPRMPGGVAA